MIAFPLLTDRVPVEIYSVSIYINMILTMMARLPQIKLNRVNKSTGQLAFITCFLNFAGAIARTFTIIAEVKDPLLIACNIEAVTLNGIIIFQFLIYWNNPSTTTGEHKATSGHQKTSKTAANKKKD